jgi:hypothetical protein
MIAGGEEELGDIEAQFAGLIFQIPGPSLTLVHLAPPCSIKLMPSSLAIITLRCVRLLQGWLVMWVAWHQQR